MGQITTASSSVRSGAAVGSGGGQSHRSTKNSRGDQEWALQTLFHGRKACSVKTFLSVESKLSRTKTVQSSKSNERKLKSEGADFRIYATTLSTFIFVSYKMYLKFTIFTIFLKCSSVAASTFTLLYNHHHHPFTEHFSSCKTGSVPIKYELMSLPPPAPDTCRYSFSVYEFDYFT